ncbi:uncharacterized protein LOC132193365 isoform X2 [Neocloeon triangulifer]|uniref:uncharacterized protein LOC132193365 isoform X2 n=1 Tax=Neocloeon triangulifer TaxID=2078957 RepID=UPI00286ECF14|nr:uncharacterized protein LOC132193365 isoform X2 [Neocloeon triangulifer]
MARLILMFVLLVAATLASQTSTKAVESRKIVEEHHEEQTKFSNATNERLDQLTKTVHQTNSQVSKGEEKLRELKNENTELRQIVNKLFNASRCNKAWRTQNLTTLSNGKQYFFSYPTYRHLANWTQANEICTHQLGMHLATIKDQTDLNAVWDETIRLKNWVWWLSARRSNLSTDFHWHDGTALEKSSSLFGRKDADGQCVSINCIHKTKTLSGRNCSFPLFFICEVPEECY